MCMSRAKSVILLPAEGSSVDFSLPLRTMYTLRQFSPLITIAHSHIRCYNIELLLQTFDEARKNAVWALSKWVPCEQTEQKKKQKNGKIKSKIESNSGRLEKINWDEENKLVP